MRTRVRLGYAATAHGHQGDTVDISYTLVSTATTHRGLYVDATRGRAENHLLVVTEEPELTEARDVLEFVLTNDRADISAIVQRRHLAEQGAHARRSQDERLAQAMRAVAEAHRRAASAEEAARCARAAVASARAALIELESRRNASLPIVRARFRSRIHVAQEALDTANAGLRG